MSVRTMIIDDEPFVRKDLRRLLAQQSVLTGPNHIQVVCEAGTVAAAKKMLLENTLDLVFLDVQLRGGTGFELISCIDASVDIIFVSAYDQYAIRAFEVNALDYILKPVTPQRLAAALLRLRERTNGATGQGPTGAHKAPRSQRLRPDDCVLIKSDSSRLFVSLKDCVAITTIGGNYASIILNNGKKVLCRKTIKEWETCLPESAFIRIHRSAIINTAFTERISFGKDGTCTVVQTGHQTPFSVSRRMGARFKNLMKQKQF